MNKYLRWTLITLGTIVIVFLLFLGAKYILPVLTPFVIAAILAELINPLVTALNRKFKMSRSFAVITVLVIVCVILGIVVSVMVTEVVVEIDELSSNLSAVDKSITQVLTELVNKCVEVFNNLPTAITDIIMSNQSKFYVFVQDIVNFLMGIVRSLPQASVVTVISIISTFFIARDRDQIIKFVNSFIPKSWKPKVAKVQRELSEGFVGYIKAQVILMSITSVMAVVVFSILNVKYAWLLGMACGILDIIPLVGPSLMILPWAGYMCIIGNVPFAIKLVIGLFVMSVVREMCSAKVVGSKLRLHPLAAIMAVYVGLRTMGPFGFLIGPLLLILLRSLYNIFLAPIVNKYN